MAEADDVLRTLHEKLKKKRLRALDLFKSIDSSGDGSINAQELRVALIEMGIKLNDQDFSLLMGRIDKDGNGDVSLKEFDRALSYAGKLTSKKKPEKRKQGLTKDDLDEFRQIFFLFKQLCRTGGSEEPELVDWDESGNIAVDELEQLLETVGLKLTNSELDIVVRDLDKNNDGNVDFEEFCSSMTEQIQLEYNQEEISNAFASFQKSSPEGLIKVNDLREALKTHMYSEMIDAEVDELIFQYKDCFVRLPGSDEEYFNFQDYINLMAPIGGFGSD